MFAKPFRRTRSVLFLLALVTAAVTLSGCLAFPSDDEAAPSPPTGRSPYVALAQSGVRGLTPEQIDAYENGKGFSMALPAELNGYPGPTHVLDLEKQLDLTSEQKAAMETLRDQMRAKAIAQGRDVLALHKALDDGFRNGTLDEARLADLLEEAAHEDAELRLIHLTAHLQAAEILTPHQNALYVELRGYGQGDHAAHEH